MFKTNPEDLESLLKDAARGNLQLPDFQRDYVWGDMDVRGLIASIAKGFPVGALLTLESGGRVRFKPRPVEGSKGDRSPRTLLLDGQQRITSLFQALFTPEPVRTKNTSGRIVERHYYLNMQRAVELETDILDAIEGVPADRIKRSNFNRDVELDLSRPEYEVEQKMFPLDRTFDDQDWWYAWQDFWGSNQRDLQKEVQALLKQIQRYKMPVIELDRDNSREAVCLIFEKVNVGGKKLDAFELVTAIFAADNFDLREDWMDRRARMFEPGDTRSFVLKGTRPNQQIESTNLLQAVTFMHTRQQRLAAEAKGVEGKKLTQVSLQRGELLELTLPAYQKHADACEEGFRNAAGFLHTQKVFWAYDLPYPPQRVALAALFAARGNKPLSATEAEKVSEWFWAVSLGELYGSATETRIARDVTEILGWFDGGDIPRSVREASFRQERLDQLQMRLSAAYKAIHALLMRSGCRDFITGTPVEAMTAHSDPLDIHHIFPRAWYEKRGISDTLANTIVNKTALSARTNRVIGGRAPSEYLTTLQKQNDISDETMDSILRSHLIEPQLLREDRFDDFHAARREALTELIQSVLKNPVLRDVASEPDEEAQDTDTIESVWEAAQ